jgi:hypothetical protein
MDDKQHTARIGDHAILQSPRTKTSLVHLVNWDEHEVCAATVVCGSTVMFVHDAYGVNDLNTDAPVTCLWCLAGAPL